MDFANGFEEIDPSVGQPAVVPEADPSSRRKAGDERQSKLTGAPSQASWTSTSLSKPIRTGTSNEAHGVNVQGLTSNTQYKVNTSKSTKSTLASSPPNLSSERHHPSNARSSIQHLQPQSNPSKVSMNSRQNVQNSNSNSTPRSSTSLGCIPIIGGSTIARLPSHLQAKSTVLSNNSASTSNGSSAKGKGKGKEKEVIDLTTSDQEEEDDDDVIVDDSPICIGSLTSFALILYPVPELQPLASTNPAVPARPTLPVHIYRVPMEIKGSNLKGKHNETLNLFTPISHALFGVLERKVANVLGPLLGDGYSGTGVNKSSLGKVWCEAEIVRRNEKNPTMLPINLLLFIRPYNIAFVSNTLADASIYLDHPKQYDPAHHSNYRYSNPHNPAGGERRRTQMTTGLAGGSGLSAGVQVSKSVDVQRQQVEDLIQNLKSGVDVDEAEAPPMVTTKLYPHQKQALSFLLDRERGSDPSTIEATSGVEVLAPADELNGLWQSRRNFANRVIGWSNAVVTDFQIDGANPPPQSRGAILADDMGLGKTIVIISLVAKTLDFARSWALNNPIERESADPRFGSFVGATSASKEKLKMSSEYAQNLFGADPEGFNGKQSTSGSGSGTSKKQIAKAKKEARREAAVTSRFDRLIVKSRATLIVCPLSTMQNWESQFAEHIGNPDDNEMGQEGKKSKKPLSIYIYHGSSRTTDALDLTKYDVVLTTFSTVAAEYSKQDRAFEQAQQDLENGGEKAEEEIAASSDDDMLVCDEFGVPVVKEVAPIKKAARKRKRIEGSGDSPLQQVQWYRIVLDEAHIIKEYSTIQARAACDLSASRRIALSGTPIQNSLNDLFSLIRFLRFEPFTDRSIWTQYISSDPLGVSRLQLIMRHLTLRRTKQSVDKDGKRILDLPPNTVKLVHLKFSPAEHAFYSSRHARYKHDFAKLQETDTVMKNYCSILQELLRLRQICDHLDLVRSSEDANIGTGDSISTHGISKSRAIQLLSVMNEAGSAQCVECGKELLPSIVADDLEDLEAGEKKQKKPKKILASTSTSKTASAVGSKDDSLVITICKHQFCRPCFQKVVYPPWPELKSEDRVECSVCREVITPAIDVVELELQEVETGLQDLIDADVGKGKKVAKRIFEHSTKTEALVRDLFPFSQANPASVNYSNDDSLYDTSRTDSTGGTIGFQPVKNVIVKSVVFSQWTQLLNRAGDALDSQGIEFARLDGTLDRNQRTKAMDEFRLNPSCEVLLVSLRAGGVGLNLTSGRRVYIMEPYWNPAVENQAIDRVHRLGQQFPVQTIRFIMDKSIEVNMLKIQLRKTELANLSLTQTLSKEQLKARRQEDLRVLFS